MIQDAPKSSKQKQEAPVDTGLYLRYASVDEEEGAMWQPTALFPVEQLEEKNPEEETLFISNPVTGNVVHQATQFIPK